MKIALDAMGGDYAPEEIVEGAKIAIDKISDFEKIYLIGDKNKIQLHVSDIPEQKIEIVHTDTYITMDEQPAVACRRKKDASINIAARMVKNKDVDALISAGSTGAQLAASLFNIGRIKGVKRPCISAPIPTPNGIKLLLDCGANTSCDAFNLKQFAIMGSLYVEKAMLLDKPKVALLNNGKEATKGSDLTKETYELLKNTDEIFFVGNIEPSEILSTDVDVMVTDGFTGNMIMKTMEGLSADFFKLLKDKIHRKTQYKLGASIMKPVFKDINAMLDSKKIGGAPLLGINGLSIVCHGNSNREAIFNAIRRAQMLYKENFIQYTAEKFIN